MMVLAYVAAMVAANLLVWKFGPWFSPINAFFLIGLDLTLRDKLHERYNGSLWVMGGIVAGASAITYLLNPGAQKIAIASAVAFGAAACADWVVYSILRKRGYLTRVTGSNIAGAAADSILFPTLAFGALLPGVIALQFAAKVGGGALWAFVLRPRHKAA